MFQPGYNPHNYTLAWYINATNTGPDLELPLFQLGHNLVNCQCFNKDTINKNYCGVINQYVYHWTRSWAININRKLVCNNAKSMDMILNLFIKTGNDYSLAVNNTESLLQLTLFLHVMLELGLNSIITSYVLLDIYLVKQSHFGLKEL